MTILRDVLPHEFHGGAYDDSPAGKLLDRTVIAVHGNNGQDQAPWPGKHKNVRVWWSLDNGRAVGWNESPTLGWSFPAVRDRPQAPEPPEPPPYPMYHPDSGPPTIAQIETDLALNPPGTGLMEIHIEFILAAPHYVRHLLDRLKERSGNV